MLTHRRAAAAGVLLLTFVFAGAAFAATTVVRPSNMDGWETQEAGTASVAFVSGPAGATGAGSAQLSVGPDGNSAAQLRTANYDGMLLADIETLTYRTFVQQDGSGGQAPYLILNVDLDGNGTTDDQLFFEPVYQTGAYSGDPVPDQGAPAVGTWQTWDARAGGWWSLNDSTFGPPLVTLDSYSAENPGARLAAPSSGAGSVRIVAGFGAGAWDHFVGNVDTITVNADTYDFEPSPPEPANQSQCKNGGWMNTARADGSAFRNQGDCIQYVNTGK